MKVSFLQELETGKDYTNEDIISLILKTRDLKEPLTSFLKPKNPLSISLADWGLAAEIKKTLEILAGVRQRGGTIVVYTDYDADGITGGSILWETLHSLDFKVMPYVPHRQTEGYGFSIAGINAIKEKYDPSLIISVDHGITAREQVRYAASLGMPVIITDHHLKPAELPDAAEAIFHVPELSGSGVAYFFAKMCFEHFGGQVSKMRRDLLDYYFAHDYLSLASIGTLADLVPLNGASRSVVKYGLAAFSQMRRVGMQEILREAGIEGKRITPYEIGFIIAPRINAIGRLEHAIDALRLLCTRDTKRAAELASKVAQTNRDRQALVTQAVNEAVAQVESNYGSELPAIITLTSDHWHEGIIGLISSRITEKYNRPTIVITKGDGKHKGSARSIGDFHITDFLRSLREHLIDVGGHKGAAGFSIEGKKLAAFQQKVSEISNTQFTTIDLEKSITADLKLPISRVSLSLAKALEELEPFGIGNQKPIFYSHAQVLGADLFGKRKEHLKLYVKDPQVSSFPFELVQFSGASLKPELARGRQLDIVFNGEIDRWTGTEKLRGRLIHAIV